MGTGSSNVAPVLEPVKEWPWTRVLAVIKTYCDEELDFGIDHETVSTLTGLTSEDAKTLIQLLAKADTGMVNAITLLITLVCVAESGKPLLEARLETVFDLMDFDNSSQITYDELTILLLCVGASFSNALGRKDQCPTDEDVSRMSQAIYEYLGKKSTRALCMKGDFMAWSTQCLSQLSSDDINIDSVFDLVMVKKNLGTANGSRLHSPLLEASKQPTTQSKYNEYEDESTVGGRTAGKDSVSEMGYSDMGLGDGSVVGKESVGVESIQEHGVHHDDDSLAQSLTSDEKAALAAAQQKQDAHNDYEDDYEEET